MNKRNRKGFTLIELIVVISIIGILAAIIFPGIDKIKGRGRDSKRIADVSQLRLALEHYFNLYRQYPVSIYNDSLNIAGSFASAGVVSTPVPTDPSKGNYLYVPYCKGSTVPNSFHLAASLEQPNDDLRDDADIEPGANVCSGGGYDFSGSDSDTVTKPSGYNYPFGYVYDFTE